jgi:hypothetical protein
MVALQRAVAHSADLAVRFATLMNATLADPAAGMQWCQDLGVERSAADLLAWTQTWPAARVIQATPEALLGLLESRRLLHHPGRLGPMAQVWMALAPQAGAAAAEHLGTALQAAARVPAEELRSQGLAGPALGGALRQRRLQAIRKALSPLAPLT